MVASARFLLPFSPRLVVLFLLCLTSATLAGAADPAAVNREYRPRTRHYFVAAEDVKWDYAPTGKNNIKPAMGLGEWGKVCVYDKTRYVEYTDAAFTKKKSQPEHLGILGPTIRAVVGDTIKVHFKNKAKGTYSIHPHGVLYDKDSEGAPYAGIPGKGHAVSPGKSFTYTWKVPARAGPGPNDGSSVIWLYHSHVNSVPDVYRGLIGTMIVTRADAAREDARPEDVDRELITLFMVFNENGEDEDEEGHLMHAINGTIFGNLPGLTMTQGERVRWYLVGLGTEVDIHTPHWHGETVLHEGRRTDVINLMPATMTVADMKAENVGTWLYHCHVADHITAGMLSLFTVEGKTAGN
ncbi:MAG: multicopper oxidase domain-containing protein [Planctomycetes bacterium]|nr:multicopper oxidase domain-containing protein [Planctomycetota bacterium]